MEVLAGFKDCATCVERLYSEVGTCRQSCIVQLSWLRWPSHCAWTLPEPCSHQAWWGNGVMRGPSLRRSVAIVCGPQPRRSRPAPAVIATNTLHPLYRMHGAPPPQSELVRGVVLCFCEPVAATLAAALLSPSHSSTPTHTIAHGGCGRLAPGGGRARLAGERLWWRAAAQGFLPALLRHGRV